MISLLQHCRRHTVAILALGAALASPSAWAAGTASGTEIENNARVNYSVGGVAQTTQSNTAKFKVDNVVRVLVAESNNQATSVTPGASQRVLTFTVTNTGNTTQDYSLATGQVSSPQSITLGVSTYNDSFDASPCLTYLDTNGSGSFDSGTDTQADNISNLAPEASKTVFVVCNIPLSLANGAAAIVSLTATTWNAGKCPVTGACPALEKTTQTTTVDDPNGVDVVWGDAAGTDDSTRDGKHSARDAYVVATATLSISKTVAPICDPFNFNSQPKNVPGAYVQYAITISNASTAAQSATLTTITDALPAQIKFDPDFEVPGTSACGPVPPSVTPVNPESGTAGKGFKLICAGTSNTRSCKTTAVYYTGALDSDAVTVSGQSVTATAGATLLPAEGAYTVGELKPGESITIYFNAIIQ